MTHAEAAKKIEASGIVGACHGDFPRVKTILETHPELIDAMNALDPSAIDETPQGAAAHTQSKEIVEYLHHQGVRLDVFMAAAAGDAERVNAFLRENPSLTRTHGAHGIPLIAHASNSATVDVMLAHGVECDIFMAVTLGVSAQVAKLLKADPSLATARTAQGLSLVQAACAMGHKEIVKMLLDAGADDPEDAGQQFLAGAEVMGQKWAGHYFQGMDLHGAAFNNVNLGRSTFHNINMAGAVLLNINLRNAIIDFATIDGLKIFGVEVRPLIEAELKRRGEASPF
jgi:ankyrin repeat protein